MSAQETFFEVITAAIKDLSEYGYDSPERVTRWVQRITLAAREALVPESVLVQKLRQHLGQVFERTSGQLLKTHKGISQFTLAQIRPKLRGELDRRIVASANLIKLNREASIQRTLQRFQGWATSIPIGGSKVVDKKDERQTIRRGIAGLPMEERRVIVDQGHKMVAAINDIVATDGGAIAGQWRHVMEGGGYQARPEHERRNNEFFLIRDSWAHKKGFVKGRFTDQIEMVGELPFCRCWYKYVYSISALPAEMITAKGREAQLAAREKMAAFA